MKNQDSQDDYTFLRPLNDDPGIEPESQFVNTLRNKLIAKAKMKKSGTRWMDGVVAAFLLTAFIVSLFLLIENPFTEQNLSNELRTPVLNKDVPISELEEKKQREPVKILEKEKIVKLFTINYGEETGNIGQPQIMLSGDDLAAASFFVKDNLFYILDNKDKKIVVTDGKEHQLTIPLNESDYRDIFVDGDRNIYVFDYNKVNKFDHEGTFLKEYPTPDSYFRFTAFTINHENEPVLFDGESEAFNFVDGKIENIRKEYNGTMAHVEVSKSFEDVQIILENQNEKTKLNIPFEHSYIHLIILDINADQIIFDKTEKSQERSESQSHIYVIDKSGSVLGAVRIPTDHTAYYSDQRIRLENGQFYFMSAESDGVSIYSLTPGKIYEKKLSKED